MRFVRRFRKFLLLRCGNSHYVTSGRARYDPCYGPEVMPAYLFPLGCPAPYVLLQPVQTCTPGSLTSCPANYFCSYDAAGQRYVCCGTGVVVPTNPCPNNGQAYINPATGQAQVCILGSASTGCPSPYGCAYSSTMRNYYCCSVFRPPVTIRPPTGDGKNSLSILASNL